MHVRVRFDYHAGSHSKWNRRICRSPAAGNEHSATEVATLGYVWGLRGFSRFSEQQTFIRANKSYAPCSSVWQ